MSFSQEYDVGSLHVGRLLNDLDEQRREGRLCDVVLRTGGEDFPAHKCLLAATSAYFRSMFADKHNFAENTTGVVQLHSVDREGLNAILNVIYTGKLQLNLENLHSVVCAGDHFLLDDEIIINNCQDFMFSVLNSEHAANEVLNIKKTAEMYSLGFIVGAANAVLSKHMTDVLESQAFLDLSFDTVADLLQHDSIHGSDEMVFWYAAMRWLTHDFKTREMYLPMLMEHIRFVLIDAQFLVLVVQPNELMQSSASCQKMIANALKFKLLPEMQSLWALEKQHRPRCDSEHTAIYCLSGWQHFKCYLPQHDRWYALRAPEALALVETPKGCTAKKLVLSVEGSVYVAVQFSHPEEVCHFDMQLLLAYELNTNSWKSCALPTLSNSRTSVALIGCLGSLYACCRNSIEKYNPSDDSWNVVTKCQIRPCHLMVSDDNRLYFYNLRDGWVQEVRLNSHDHKPDMMQQQNVPPNRFFAGFTSAVKLGGMEVLVSLRTLTGVHRKIFNIRTNLWKDANLWEVRDDAKQHLGLLDFCEPLPVMCDRLMGDLYFLGSKSGFNDLPAKADFAKVDATLPFFRYNLGKKTWTRLASLPEFMSAGGMEICMSDRLYSMAQPCTL